MTITNATISGNRTTNNNKNGGGVYAICSEVTIAGAAIEDNTCTGAGGGIYTDAKTVTADKPAAQG